MSLPWFRFYTEALDDPKVQRLDASTFKHWVNLLCLAARHNGALPHESDIAFALRIDEVAVSSLLDRLVIAGLIDVRKGGPNGSYIAPHNWDKRQYKSDTSTERVKRFRQRSRNVTETASETPPDTEQIQNRTENIEPKGSCASGDALTPDEIVEEWNELAESLGLAKVRKLTDARRRKLKVRLREYPDLEDWQRAFAHIRETPFLRGDGRDGWRADFDFLLQAKSFTKLTEQSYGKN